MTNFTFDNKKHAYMLDGKPMSGVTTVLGVIAKPMLIGWASRMAVEYIRDHTVDFVGGTAEERQVILESAKNAHTKKKTDAGDKGTDVHTLVEDYIKTCLQFHGTLIDSPSIVDPMLRKFVDWASANKIKFLESEKRVYNDDPSKWYAGTFDFSFEKDGKRFIGDLKTMKKMWDRVPFFQTAAYKMASERMGEPAYDGSCIININKETNELTEHWSYDWESDQKAFESALYLYRQLNQ